MSKEFSKVFSQLRRSRGLSQRQVAEDLKISQALLSHYENGLREPRLDFIVAVCDYYGVSADFLLGRTGLKNNIGVMINSLRGPEAQNSDTQKADTVIAAAAAVFESSEEPAKTMAMDYFELSVYKMLMCMDMNDQDAMAELGISGQTAGKLCTALSLEYEAKINELSSVGESIAYRDSVKALCDSAGEKLKAMISDISAGRV